MVNHIKEVSVSGESETLDLSNLFFVDTGGAFIAWMKNGAAHHPYVLKTARCCF